MFTLIDINNLIDVIAIIISLIALATSIYIWKKTDDAQKQINNTNLESVIYLDVFKDFLINKIPLARNELYIDSKGKICEYSKLIDVLLELKKSALYFNYRNSVFYKKITKKVSKLEDILVISTSKIFLGVEKDEKLKEIDERLIDLYQYIVRGYFGDL